jgi:hypothetical protein
LVVDAAEGSDFSVSVICWVTVVLPSFNLRVTFFGSNVRSCVPFPVATILLLFPSVVSFFFRIFLGLLSLLLVVLLELILDKLLENENDNLACCSGKNQGTRRDEDRVCTQINKVFI